MFHLATKPKHVFGEAHNVPADPARDRLAQAERTCKICGVVKITALPDTGDAYRLWRLPGADEQVVLGEAPACAAVSAPEVSAA